MGKGRKRGEYENKSERRNIEGKAEKEKGEERSEIQERIGSGVIRLDLSTQVVRRAGQKTKCEREKKGERTREKDVERKREAKRKKLGKDRVNTIHHCCSASTLLLNADLQTSQLFLEITFLFLCCSVCFCPIPCLRFSHCYFLPKSGLSLLSSLSLVDLCFFFHSVFVWLTVWIASDRRK